MALALPPDQQSEFRSASEARREKLLDTVVPTTLIIRVEIVDPLKTLVAGRIEVLTSTSSCGLRVSPGEVWYLSPQERNGKLLAELCGASRILMFPDSERRLLESARDGHHESRIEGIAAFFFPKRKALAQAVVEAHSPTRSFTATTNKDGGFELNGLPPDTYQMRLTVEGRRHDLETVKLCDASTLQVYLHPPEQ